MTLLRIRASTRPKRTCALCQRKWHGKAEITARFYGGSQRTPWSSYCRDCIAVDRAASKAWDEQYTADGLLVLRPGIQRIRKEYGPGMLRICYAAGVKPSKLGQLFVEDIKKYSPVRG